MAAATSNQADKRYAVVTGANKGIGFGICKQLASHGIIVVLTARDEKRGLDALENLKGTGFSDNVLFHQLDVANPGSVASLAEFVKTQFGKLDILVNNAGVVGVTVDADALSASRTAAGGKTTGEGRTTPEPDLKSYMSQTHEAAVECLQINYYGAKGMVEALAPLLQFSRSPRIVNVSSSAGKIKDIPSEWAKGILNDERNLTEERVDELVEEFLKDFKEASLEAKGWPTFLSAYKISKAAMNAHTRIVAKKYPNFKVNCVCPGFVKTDVNFNIGVETVEEGAANPVRLALLPDDDDAPSGAFFIRTEMSSF